MEDANKALIMAAGILLAIMILSLFVSSMTKISKFPETEDELKKAEQISEFNKEYEVFQKSGMYGVDVISCLNKAKSNNEKYVEGGSFLGTHGYGENYEVDVTVKLKTKLSETISVTAVKSNLGASRESVIYESGITVKDKNNRNLKLDDVFDIDTTKQLTSFNQNQDLKYEMSKESSDMNINITYSLVNDEDTLLKILGHANNPRQIVKNTETNPNLIYDISVSPPSYGWSSATWSTYLYSFKQKKFKCINLEYSEKTGLVNKIEFEEL